MNTTVQLLTVYTDRECHSAQRYIRTERRSDIMMPIADYRTAWSMIIG